MYLKEMPNLFISSKLFLISPLKILLLLLLSFSTGFLIKMSIKTFQLLALKKVKCDKYGDKAGCFIFKELMSVLFSCSLLLY